MVRTPIASRCSSPPYDVGAPESLTVSNPQNQRCEFRFYDAAIPSSTTQIDLDFRLDASVHNPE